MTDVDVTVSDGLRLSELYGQLADAQWIVDNWLIADMKVFAVVVLTGLAVIAVAAWMMYDDYELPTWRFAVGATATMAVFIVIGVIAMWICHQYEIHDVAVIQAQIDALESKLAGGCR